MKRIFEKRVVPIAVLDKADDAVPVAEALVAGGLDIIEVTFRTPAAEECLRRIAKALPQMLAGAGTILSTEQVDRAIGAGAGFGVSPGLNDKVVSYALQKKLAFMPGVMTPSEVERAMELGVKLLKFFPAEQAGGVKMLKALAGPYQHTGAKFVPLGGVSLATAAEYLAMPTVAAIGGSWLVDSKVIADKNWKEITSRVQRVMALVGQTQPQPK